MLTTIQSDTLSRSQVVNTLATIRQEWEAAVDGESLVDIQGSIGLLLIDLVIGLLLGQSEQQYVLGAALQSKLRSIEGTISENNR